MTPQLAEQILNISLAGIQAGLTIGFILGIIIYFISVASKG